MCQLRWNLLDFAGPGGAALVATLRLCLLARSRFLAFIIFRYLYPYNSTLPTNFHILTPLMASTPERDERLLSIGRQCSDPHCSLVDFLPFKCHHCAQSFCGEHFKVEAHSCPRYDESKHNRVAPSCTSYLPRSEA